MSESPPQGPLDHQSSGVHPGPHVAEQHPIDQRLYGGFLIGVGIAFGAMAWRLKPAGMMNERDIGPTVVPFLLAMALLVGGVSQIFARQISASKPALARQPTWVRWQPWLVILGLVAWTLAMPLWGFMATGFLFSVGILKLMGAGLVSSLMAAAVLIPLAHALFVEGFHVVLPRGPWGF